MSDQNIPDPVENIETENENKDPGNKNPDNKKSFHINIHVILISLIVLLFGISAVRLYIWNKGEVIEIDPDADTSEFDVEALDSIMPLPSAKKAGHTYDDELSILFLGDNTMAGLIEDETTIANQVAALTGATVYNGAFPNCTLAPKNMYFNEADEPADVFTLPYVVDSLCTGDFSLQNTIRERHRGDGNISANALEVLKSVDIDKIDVICIAYGADDYLSQRGVENPDDPYEICTYTGALRTSIQNLQQNYPYIRIIIMSPTYVCVHMDDGGEGYEVESGTFNFGHGVLSHYLLKEIDVCTEMAVSIVDNFYGTINQDNYAQYLEEDGKSLNDQGRALMAERFTFALNKYK